ncbi:MAG: TIGR03936 family radical SAM-associated protein [Thermodesulfovibrionales bacterium]|nr:TIGR03936 family radical SAM-associated protein [Thermodesulfovibrionales bacterium]
MNLSQFSKPSRYINNEINAIKKTSLEIRIALAFPDLYEIGMSHIGLKILYDILNSIEYCSAERVFMPAPDFAGYLKANNTPLYSLETKTSLKDFDVLGFSLQYELSFTTLLEMLSLSDIPIESVQRIDSRNNYPIVVAGGPCAQNPLPLMPFIDCFFIGESEETIIEFVAIVKALKGSKRIDILREVSKIEGIYVPLIHGKDKTIKRRFVRDIDKSPFPTRPVVPYMSIVHDRIAIEISRGCPNGCRFCQAGVIYRPFRQRSIEKILEIAGQSIKNTGHDTVSLSSLSAGDFACLLPLMRLFNRSFAHKRINLSLPSLRVGSVNMEVLQELKAVRKSGFTIAPEAATDRLRAVINKDFTYEDYEHTVRMLFDAGWHNLKLYFMIGLPTETEKDIEAIPHMAGSSIKLAKKKTSRFVNVSVTISPFIPKAHTPFQWCGQIDKHEMIEKMNFLQKSLSSRRIKYKGHTPEMSIIEAFIARGDEGISDVIKVAWQNGAILDGWSEYFNYQHWIDASEKTGIDTERYATKKYDTDENLPWDFIDTGIDKDFLKKEYMRAKDGIKTPSCIKRCSACGLNCKDKGDEMYLETNITTIIKEPYKNRQRIRVCFSKTGDMRHLSHLELTHCIVRALRRADINLCFSEGFNPSAIVSFGPPLNVGVSGLNEYFDMEVFEPFDIQLMMQEINQRLPDGIKIHKMSAIPHNTTSLTSFIKRFDYCINGLNDEMLSRSDDYKSNPDISNNILSIEKVDNKLSLCLIDTDTKKVRLSEIIGALIGKELWELDIERTRLYGYKKGWCEPL